MSRLFGRERSVVTKHLRNVFAEGELGQERNVQNLHIAGPDKPVRFYSLDVVISVGHRVKSVQGTRFPPLAAPLAARQIVVRCEASHRPYRGGARPRSHPTRDHRDESRWA